jgi:hypothetical protein
MPGQGSDYVKKLIIFLYSGCMGSFLILALAFDLLFDFFFFGL